MNALFIVVLSLLGFSSYDDLHQRKQIKEIHDQADQAVATIAEMKTQEKAQAAAQDRENVARSAADVALRRQLDVQATYIVATATELAKPAPTIANAIQFNSLALNAGVTPSAAAIAQGQALAAAESARKDQLIADLQSQLKDAKDAFQQKTAEVKQAVADKNTATGKIVELTNKDGEQTAKIQDLSAEKKDLGNQFLLLSARYGQVVFWGLIAAGLVFLLFHLGLFAHLKVRSALVGEQTAHAATRQQLAQSVAAHNAVAAILQTSATTAAAAAAPKASG